MRRLFPVLLVALGAMALAACAQSDASSASGTIKVVAAENFYGNLASQIGGDRVAVTSIVTNPNADPHLFEPGSRAGLAVDQAQVVIANGAGYDDWMTKLLDATGNRNRSVVTVADVLNVHGNKANPHLWYDIPRLNSVVIAIGHALAAADPDHASSYRNGVARTIEKLAPLNAAVSKLRHQHPGAPVAYTEPVPGLLLQAAGLDVRTPAAFARAIEDGTDPAASDVATMRALIAGHQVRALLYNEQATSPITASLQQLATASGVPIVAVTETMPPGTNFESWQLDQIQALERALSR